MTAFDRFDPFDPYEQRIAAAIDEIAGTRRPDYIDDVLRQTARTTQRPRWAFPGRWVPMASITRRAQGGMGLPERTLLILGLLVALAIAGGLLIAGAQRPVLRPFGPAANGQIVYSADGDLYVRDSLAAPARLLIGGPGEQAGASHSPNGLLVAYDNEVDGADHPAVANADGSDPRVILPDVAFTNGTASWSPDSSTLALTTDAGDGVFRLWLAAADGSGARRVDVPGLQVRDVQYNPADDGTLLIRGDDGLGHVNLYLVTTEGAIVRRYDVPGEMVYGAQWELAGSTFSPDGRLIAYNSVEPVPGGAHFLTWVMNADGSERRRLPTALDDPAYSQAWPVFSPDSSTIAMESWVGKPGGPAVNRLAVVAADGASPARQIGPSFPNQGLIKTWSADGQEILLSLDGRNEVYEVDPVSGEATKLPFASDLPDVQRRAP